MALDQAGVSVTVIEAQPLETIMAAPFDGRALALMYGSRRVLDGMGLWPAFADIAEPVRGVRVRDQGTGACMAFDAASLDQQALAYGITNGALRRRLLELCRARGITLLAPARLAGLRRRADAVTATLDDGSELRASLVVGADGRGSVVRELARIGARRWRYPQSAITFALRLERPHDQCVHEHLRPAGPLALLPIGPGFVLDHLGREPCRCGAGCCVWTPRACCSSCRTGSRSTWRGRGCAAGQTGHPLERPSGGALVAPRVALVGDAAHGLHPIHAQGFNLAVRDVAALAEVVVDGLRAGADPGGAEALLRYDRWPHRCVADGRPDRRPQPPVLHRPAAAKLVRGLGFAAIERLPPLKQLAMRRGMGLAIC